MKRLSLKLTAVFKAGLLLFFISSHAADAAEPFFMGLGDLPGGTFSSYATAVSADGSVVVGGSSSTLGGQAFRWTQSGGMLGLGDLPGANFYSVANRVSSDGTTVVGGSNNRIECGGVGPCRNRPGPFRWTQAGGMSLLGTYGTIASASDVSADGSVIVGSTLYNGGFHWTQDTGMEFFPGVDGALGVSTDGSVVVCVGGGEVFRWTAGAGMISLNDLGDLPGDTFSSGAYGVSRDGSVVVGWSDSDAALGYEAFRWTPNGGMVGLGILPGSTSSLAYDVSTGGSIIVGYSGGASGSEAFVWDAAHGMRSLRDVLVNDFGLGASLAGWTLEYARGVSADGQFIVGSGTNPSGNTEAWLARIELAPTLSGDFNNDGTVDAADYTVWRKGLGTTYTQNDYNTWRAHFSQTAGGGAAIPSAEPLSAAVPEPATVVHLTLAALGLFMRFRRRTRVCSFELRGLVAVSIVLFATAGRASAAMFSVASVPELVATINAANQNAEPDTITLSPGTTFTLTEVNNSTFGTTGLPAITANEKLTVLGNGAIVERSAAAGTPDFRLFDVATGASLALVDLTLQHGRAFGAGAAALGGAINSRGDLALTSVILQNNVAQGINGSLGLMGPGGIGRFGLGGGIYSAGTLLLENTTLQYNRAEGGDGGAGLCRGPTCFPAGPGGYGEGGGLYVEIGTATLRNSNVTSNTALGGDRGPGGGSASPGNGYGGGIYIADAQVGLDEFTLAHVTSNTASTNYPNIFGPFDVIPNANPLPGDYNADGVVNTADYVVWRNSLGIIYTQSDYNVWRAHFGETAGGGVAATSSVLNRGIPEPSALTMVLGGLFAAGCRCRRALGCTRSGLAIAVLSLAKKPRSEPNEIHHAIV